MSLHPWFKSLKQSSRRRNRKSNGRPAHSRNQRRLFLEGLEDRRLLAALSDDGSGTLTIELATNEALTVVSNSNGTYSFGSNQAFTNAGVASSGDFSVFGGTILVLQSSGLAHYDTISIVDAGANARVTFNNSGANAYSTNIEVNLDDTTNIASGFRSVQFFGASNFTGSNSLHVATSGNILLNWGFPTAKITTDSGAITLEANQQGTTAGNFVGIFAGDNPSFPPERNVGITSTSGAITLKGRGGSTTNTTGVYLGQGTLVSSSGPIHVHGSGGTNGGTGLFVRGPNQTPDGGIISTNSDVTVVGDGGTGPGTGVFVNPLGQISAGGNGNVTVTGTAGTAGWGVSMNTGLIQSRDGDVTVTGTGGDRNLGVSNAGVSFNGTITSTGDGTVRVNGFGGHSNRSEDYGVSIQAGGLVSSSGGSIFVTGMGGGDGSAIFNHGVVLLPSATIKPGGNGNVTVEGTGGAGQASHGVSVDGGTNPNITSSGGNVTVRGTAVSTGSNGVDVRGTSRNGLGGGIEITAENTGTVTIEGVSQTQGSGVAILNYGDVTSGGGDITITGTGGSTGNNNFGVVVSGNSVGVGFVAEVAAGGAGNVFIHGTGGNSGGVNNDGVRIGRSSPFDNNGQVLANGGNITITGIAGTGTGQTGIGVSGGLTNGLIATSNSGNVTLTADTMKLEGPVSAQTRTVTLQPATTDGSIGANLGGADSTGELGLFNSELAQITAGTINIGNATTGTITVSAPITRPAATDLNLTTATGVSPFASGTDLNLAGGALAISSGADLNINIGGLVVDTGYNQLKVTGDVNLNGLDLALTGAFESGTGNVFTIVSATSVSGTFNDLPENAVAPFNGRSLRVNYTATTVTLTDTGVYNPNSPPVADAGGPYTITVGESLTLDASGSSDPDDDLLTFAWDLTDDGAFTNATGVSPTLSWAALVALGIDGPGDYDVAVEANDGLETNVATTTLTVLHATPTITIDWTGGTYNGSEFVATGSVLGFDDSEIGTPTFTYFVGLDTTGTLLAAAPVNAGTYTVRADFAGDALHTAALETATITITARSIEVTADGLTKTYGDNDPALSYQVTDGNLVGGDTFSGALSRVSGEDVGSYAIQQGSLGLSANYDLSFVDAELAITQRLVTVTADNQSKIYGETDPALTYRITDGSLAPNDEFFGALARAAGEDAGNYAITQGSLGLSANYDLSFVEAELTITRAMLTGDATTQNALNMAKQGMLNITVANIQGFVNGENADVFLTNASFWITIDDVKYEFVPTSVKKLSDSSISISYRLKNSGLLASFGNALEGATSGATALQAGFVMASTNYSLSDEFLTRLFSTVK